MSSGQAKAREMEEDAAELKALANESIIKWIQCGCNACMEFIGKIQAARKQLKMKVLSPEEEKVISATIEVAHDLCGKEIHFLKLKYTGDKPKAESFLQMTERLQEEYNQKQLDLEISLSRKSEGKGVLDQELKESKDFSSEAAMKDVGVKFDDDKVAYHLIPPYALHGAAMIFKYGGSKYNAWNHSKGMPWSKQYRAALGHIFEIGKGNLEDADTGAGHIYHAICSLMMLAENMIMYPEHNDLYPKAYSEKQDRLRTHLQKTYEKVLDAIKRLKKEPLDGGK